MVGTQHTAQAQEIGEDAGRGDVRPCPGSANDQGVLAVSPSDELHDVISETDVRERMIEWIALQPHARLAGPLQVLAVL